MSNRKTVFLCVGIALLSAASAWVCRGVYDTFVHTDIYSKIGSIETVLENEFLYEYDKTKAADYAALGLSMSLDDPYTMYYDRKQFQEYTNASSGDYIGIGVTVAVKKETDEIEVVAVTDESPAFIAGVLPGDIITAIEGETFTGSRLNDAVTKIKAADSDGNVEGTTVTVTVRRDGEVRDIVIVRQRIHEKTVKYEMLDNGIAYLRISGFNTGYKDQKSTYDEFKEAISSLTDSGMKKLIFDVRDNGGGDLEVVCGIIDMLVPEGIIIYTEDKYGNKDIIESDKNELDIPMTVLVNGNTASAAELFSGALRDYGKAKIIGTQTFGKGVMQQVIPFSDGSGMTVTIAKYFTPNGTCVQDEGIAPDVVCEPLEEFAYIPVISLERNQDVQLLRAIELIDGSK